MPPEYEVIALRYGTLSSRRSEIFYRHHTLGDDDALIQTDYYLWIIRNDTETMLLDTGFHPDIGRRRGRTCLLDPVGGVEAIGIDRADVSRIILSHFHYDHIGNVASFPNATLFAQVRELSFWTSPLAKRFHFASVVEEAEIDFLNKAANDGRLVLLEGDREIAAGITAHLTGGHCPGQQIVTVTTSTGPVVLASDAVHFYEELDRDRPFEIFHNLVGMYRTYDLLSEWRTQTGAVIVAGHDPAVMKQFPALSEATKEFAVRIA